MSVLMTKPSEYAKCICCGSDFYDIREFQFFKDIGMKTCITLCKPCVSDGRYDNTRYSK